MKALPLSFVANGFFYRQHSRGPDWAIYEQRGGSKRQLLAYEAIKVRVRGGRTFKGFEFPAHEVYPGTSDWGKRGWTFSLFGGKVSAEDALAQAQAKVAL